MLGPFTSFRYCQDVIKDIVYLKKTHAPTAVFVSFISWAFKERTFLKPYHSTQEKFRAEKSSLTLTNDWFTKYIPYWISVFDEYNFYLKDRINALEIGSWEGLSSYFILNNLPNAELICVDTWEGADEHKSGDAATKEILNKIEKCFDSNLSKYSTRLSKYKGTSYSFFNTQTTRNQFDLIYIDGSHHCDDVIIDAIKSFEMLKIGGIMIFDDYLWQHYPNPIDNPASAINAFLKIKKGSYKIVRVYYQLIIEKTKDRY